MNAPKIAFLSVLSNSFIVILKIAVGIVTGSVAVLSEAIHSSLDLLASLIAFFSVRLSNRPADKEHPYGHGKVENISGTIETLLIFVAGIWIIYECVHKLLHPEPVHLPILGIGVMVLGAIINFAVSRVVGNVAKKTNSVAMKSNALHLLTDVYTSLGVAVSLLLVSLTDWYFLDPIIGIILAVYIMSEAYKLMKESFPPLLDARLSPADEQQIVEIVEAYSDRYIEFHNFRTRQAGPENYVDFHLVVSSEMDIATAHQLCDQIEADINEQFDKMEVLIHLEPEHEQLNKEEEISRG
ncbi:MULTISPECIES: cation diffusion facilitator family transporter [Bacillaceae]|uniref:Cation diffusion facilitator family transporter n=1 Tax=Metabacillus sediminis TaxID=3117746 RepID=A0ABZ2NIB3_9BACI|nr:cation diffusion facilitator family transporter [Bacillus sp. SJS]KZZ84000.1 cation transporter [Bacillus sp. SJS]